MNEEPLDEGEQRFVTQIFDLWIYPELVSRGLDLAATPIGKALVVFPPGSKPKVLINDEAPLVLRGKPTRTIERGEQVDISVDVSEIEAIWPHDIDKDSGWVCFARIGTVIWTAFDFRRNRQRARRLIDRAEDFLKAASWALEQNLLGPAVECGFAAAELSVTAQMLMHDDNPPRGHDLKRRRWHSWTNLGNAPPEHSVALSDLASRRADARYKGKSPGSHEHLGNLLEVVHEMVRLSRDAVTRGFIEVT